MLGSFFEKRWVKGVEEKKRKVSIAEHFYISVNGDHVHVQGFGSYEKNDAIALPLKSGKLGVFRVLSSKSYSDFGTCCFDAEAKYVNRVLNRPAP